MSKPGSIGMPKQSCRNKSRENQNFAAKEVFRSVWKTSTKVWKKSTLRMWKTPVLPVHGISSYRKRGSQRFQHLTSFFGILASHRNGAAPLSNESPGAKNIRLSPWKRYRNGVPVRSVRMAAGIARLPPKPARRRNGGERRSDTMADRPPEADARRTANRRPGIRRPQLRTADAPHSQNYLEALTVRQTLLQAELDATSDRFDEIQGVVNLYHALGGGY